MSQATLPKPLPGLKKKLRDLGITHVQVAAEASKTSKRGHVGPTLVVHVLAGRAKSSNVVAAVRRLINEAAAREGSAA